MSGGLTLQEAKDLSKYENESSEILLKIKNSKSNSR